MIGKSGVRSERVSFHTYDGSLVISFIDMPGKYAKPVKPLLECGVGKSRGTHI